jgi:hypothetical protein
MKLFDWLTGTKRPAAGVPARTPAEVRADLLGVNRPMAPFIVRDGAPENVDLVAEWRIVDAAWYEIFAKAGLKKVFKVLIKLDQQTREVRAADQEWSVEWRAGVPTLSLAVKAFRGQTREFSFGTAFAFHAAGQFWRGLPLQVLDRGNQDTFTGCRDQSRMGLAGCFFRKALDRRDSARTDHGGKCRTAAVSALRSDAPRPKWRTRHDSNV